MRGQKLYALIGLIMILTIGQLLLNIYPTNAKFHPPVCPPYCYMTYGEVENSELTSGPLRPSAPAIAVSSQDVSQEKGASKRYAYVYADGDTKVKVRIGHEVYKMFEKTNKLVGFSIMTDRKHRDQEGKDKDPDKEEVPELIAFVPFEWGGVLPPPKPPTAEEAIKWYMNHFKKCAQDKQCGDHESRAQH